ncbi:hypothetical protein T458_19610 [Brevibacillus panacihumi W25]|uniref:Lipoprotein n=1 Tax=Brevibacillus panacihumi W25 TaxID=1408254 RepID=V6M456_9BACL|nr:hypothetical protein [Brevibacillus panacihumi]EST53092.1 hypothetical protein T458_19610 [Brevibacillus panacihumi W25]
MRKGWIICLLTVTAMLGGCNQMGVQQNAGSDFEQVRDQFAKQRAYEFYGRTKLLTDNSSNANIVNFSGRKDEGSVYMNVKRSVPEENRVDSLSLLDQGKQLYAKTDGDQDWRLSVSSEAALRQEMENWNPASAFAQMDEMKKSVIPITKNLRTDQAGIRVVLDSAKLKSWLGAQLQAQTGSHVQSVSPGEKLHKPSQKLAMSLSKGDWQEPPQGTRIQSAGNANLQEIIDQMDLEAEYTIMYQKSTKLPTSMLMSIRSQYDYNNQRVQEHTQVETYLQNYGLAKKSDRSLSPVPSDRKR